MALMVKNPPASAGDAVDMGLIPGLGRSPGGGNESDTTEHTQSAVCIKPFLEAPPVNLYLFC